MCTDVVKAGLLLKYSFLCAQLRQLSRVNHPNIVKLYGSCDNPVSTQRAESLKVVICVVKDAQDRRPHSP